jgi:hypothetical protein
VNVVLFNKEDTLQLYSGFRDLKVTLSRINEWNKTKRFAKAYLDKSNDPCLEGDIELTGGVTKANVKEWIKTYAVALRQFVEFINE